MKPLRPPPRPSEPPSDGTPHRIVLYVEDDADNRQVASFRLGKRYDVRCATTDREACALFEQLGDRIWVILMDIELRGSEMNGIELARLVRGRIDRAMLPAFARTVPHLDAPIIFVTAYTDRYRTPELLMAGGNEVILKPVDFVALHTAMTRAFLRRVP